MMEHRASGTVQLYLVMEMELILPMIALIETVIRMIGNVRKCICGITLMTIGI